MFSKDAMVKSHIASYYISRMKYLKNKRVFTCRYSWPFNVSLGVLKLCIHVDNRFEQFKI